MEAKNEKLGWWTMIGYGLGDIYGGGSGVIISFSYLIFLTDAVRISPALAGTVILTKQDVHHDLRECPEFPVAIPHALKIHPMFPHAQPIDREPIS